MGDEIRGLRVELADFLKGEGMIRIAHPTEDTPGSVLMLHASIKDTIVQYPLPDIGVVGEVSRTQRFARVRIKGE